MIRVVPVEEGGSTLSLALCMNSTYHLPPLATKLALWTIDKNWICKVHMHLSLLQQIVSFRPSLPRFNRSSTVASSPMKIGSGASPV